MGKRYQSPSKKFKFIFFPKHPTIFIVFINFFSSSFAAQIESLGLPPSSSKSLSSNRESPSNKFRVVIDPGHGGSDNGAVYGDAREADISLSISKRVEKKLLSKKNISVSLTRQNDQNLSLPERVEFGKKQNADLFISLHANASPDLRVRGIEFYFQNRLPSDEESLYLSNLENQVFQNESDSLKDISSLQKESEVKTILTDLQNQAKMHKSYEASQKLKESWFENSNSISKHSKNAIRQAPFYVLAKSEIPAVLVEVGFLSNPKEAQKLMDSQYQEEIANKLADGILNFKEKVDKDQPARLD